MYIKEPWNVSKLKTSFTSKREEKMWLTDSYLKATLGSKTIRPTPCLDSTLPAYSARELSLPHPTKKCSLEGGGSYIVNS